MTRTMIGMISPRDGRAAVVDPASTSDGRPSVEVNGQTIDLSDYLARFPTTGFAKVDDQEQLQQQLEIATEQSHTLDFTLMLLDAELSRDLRRDIAGELDCLLKSHRNREYVLDVVLGHPVTDVSLLHAAAGVARGFQQTSELIAMIADCQERVRHALNAWLAIREDPLVRQTGEARVHGGLLRTGLWRRLVCDCVTQADVDRTKGELAVSARDEIDARIVQRFADAYSHELPQGDHPAARPTGKRRVSSNGEAGEDFSADEVGVSGTGLTTARPSHVLRERAKREVEKIAELFVKGSDHQARKFLDQLVSRQAQENDHSHLVKSLCNVASRCTDGGRHEIALSCLREAVKYRNGVDFPLYMQMSNLFKELRQFERATECLNRAHEHAKTREDVDSLHREFSRLLTEQGRYERALKSFEQLSDIDTSPHSRTSMARVLRKLGRLTEARKIYESVWTSVQGYYQAFAGLAEVNRQTGRLGKAISKYHFLIRQVDIEDRQSKVYRSALSSLYRASGNFEESRSILEALLRQFPHDAELKLSLAKVLRLLGEADEADELYQWSFGKLRETEKLAAILYETAIVGDRGDVNPTPSEDLAVLPEFGELATCNSMLRYILAGDPNKALNKETPRIRAYRQHADFCAVLRYHARRMIDAGCDPKSDVAVNRLRKRGYREMRRAVRAIDCGELNRAFECERRICLAIA